MEPEETRYLSFKLLKDIAPEHKTQTWGVYSVRNGTLLGQIKWWGAWIQYAFFPEPGTLFNVQCMKDICAFIKGLMRERGR